MRSQSDDQQQLSGERVEFPSRSGRMLVGDVYRVGAGTGPWLVLCHGMESNRGGNKQEAMCKRFFPLGFSILRFDFSYVGDSEGTFADMTVSGEVSDALGALDFVSGFSAEAITVIGSSLGGLVALLAAAKAPHLVRRVATLAAVGRTDLFVRGLSESDLAEWREVGSRTYGDNEMHSTFLDDVTSMDAPASFGAIEVPVLLMHGTADKVVPMEHASIIARAVSGAVETELFEGVAHRFEEPGALEAVLARIERWLVETD
jgi:pimeloyl-ACP methyl ester carboxylesterase